MSFATASRRDGGFYTLGTCVLRAPRGDRGEGIVVAMFSGTFLLGAPDAHYGLANSLNMAAGLPLVRVPKHVREAAAAIEAERPQAAA